MRYALLLMLCGCGAPSHAFMDGAPLAPIEPRTIYTPNGSGLPEYWSAPEAEPERSPHKRVLPETPDSRKGPGIWAGDRPVATIRGPMIDVLGIGVPMPATFKSKSNPATHCAVLVSSWVKNADALESDFAALTIGQRLCFVTDAMATCMEWRSLLHKRREQSENMDLVLLAKFRADIDAVLARLYAHRQLVCSDPRPPPVSDLLDKWQVLALTDIHRGDAQ